LFKGIGRWLPIVITSILFGLYHLQQDIFAVIAACLGGLYWGILYKKWNNNLWVSIISHALFDMITLILIYTGKFGKLI
jgi:membrane protease YdiL (CAAX protease family)